MSSPEFPTTSSDSTKSESSSKQSIENFLKRTSDGDIRKYMILRLHSISDGERKSNFPLPEKSPAEEITDLESNEIVLGIVKYDRNSPSNQPDKENSSREANKDSSEPLTPLPKLGSLQRLVVKELFKPPSVSNIADQLSDETQRTPCPCYPLSTESRREKWHQILDSLAKKYSSRSVSVRTHEFTKFPQNAPKVCPNSDKCCQTTFEKTTDSLNKRPATEVDLGIKLLCYLIDAKNLTKTQKKQLGKKIFEKVTMQRSQSGDGSAMISSIVSSAVSTPSPIESFLQSKDQKEQTPVQNASRGKALIKEMIEEQIQTEEFTSMHVEEAAKTPPKSSPSIKEPVTTRERLPHSIDRKGQTQIDNSYTSRGKAPIKEIIEEQIQTELPTMDVEVAAKTPPKSSPSLKEPVATRESLPQGRGRKKQTQIDNSNDSRGKALIKEMIEEQIQTEELPTMDIEVAAKTPPKSSPSLKEPVTRESLPQSRDRKEHNRSKAKTPRKSSPSPEEPVITSEWLNPLTQSEKNYDKKSKSSKSETLPSSSPGHNSRRSSQLNKIDMEIRFLEGIKTLLLQEQEPSRGNSRRSSASTRKSSKYQSPEEQKDQYNKILRRISKNLVINGEPTTDKKHSDKHSIKEEKKPSSSSSTSGKKKRRSKLKTPILTEN